MIDVKGMDFFQKMGVSLQSFNHFDYVDFLESLDDEQLRVNPRKRKIVQQFLMKCEQKMQEKQKIKKESWRNFLKRSQQHERYLKQKNQCLRYINQHYDTKSKQLLFYPKITTTKATQHGRSWKDFDQTIEKQEPIFKPNSSAFHTTCETIPKSK